MKKIVIGREAFDDIMYYVNKTNFEISGFGAVEVIDGVPTVTSIYIMDQENSSAETELDGASIAKVEYEHLKSGRPGDLRFWWHSHVNMQVFWSGTDMSAIEMLAENGWFIHGVFNKQYESRLAYSNNEPISVFIDDIEMEIDESLVSGEAYELYKKMEAISDKRNKSLDTMFQKHVTIKSYELNQSHRYNRASNILDMAGETYAPFKNSWDDWGDKPKTNESTKYEYQKDDDGYLELRQSGYTHSEIIALNNRGIYDLDDLDLEAQLGGKDYEFYK